MRPNLKACHSQKRYYHGVLTRPKAAKPLCMKSHDVRHVRLTFPEVGRTLIINVANPLRAHLAARRASTASSAEHVQSVEPLVWPHAAWHDIGPFPSPIPPDMKASDHDGLNCYTAECHKWTQHMARSHCTKIANCR